MSNYKVTLAHAVCDENGKGTNGKAGDQTGNEVRFQDYYISGGKSWDCVLRCTDREKRLKIAENAIKGVRNPHLGYDMNQRYTAYDKVKDLKFDLDKLTVDSECDCSVLATMCSCYAGIPVARDTVTANMQVRYLNTGKYKSFTDKKYLTKPDNLMVGDILVRAGHHTAIVCNTLYWLKSTIKRSNSLTRLKDVKAIQTRLNELTGANLTVDGVWGSKTDNAVKTFQKHMNLEVDGIIGRNTAEALGFLFA